MDCEATPWTCARQGHLRGVPHSQPRPAELPVADRDGQERRAAPELYRPHRCLLRARREEAPRALSDGPDRRRVDHQLPYRGVHPVGAQYQVVADGAARAELYPHPTVVGGRFPDGLSPADRHVADPGQQGLLQVGAVQGHAWADAAPPAGHVDVEQCAAAVVGGVLPLDAHGPAGHRFGESECVEGPHGVAGQVDPGARGRGPGCALDDLHRGAPSAQRAGRSQAGDTGADDQHPDTLTVHGLASSGRAGQVAGEMLRLTRNRLPGS